MMQNADAMVLDTSVVSVLFNRAPESLYKYYRNQIAGSQRVISFQTLEEVWFGAYNAGWGERRRDELAGHLDTYTVVWPDSNVADVSARLRVDRRSQGRDLKTADAWIAATALSLHYPLVAHDRDFSGIDGLTLIQSPTT